MHSPPHKSALGVNTPPERCDNVSVTLYWKRPCLFNPPPSAAPAGGSRFGERCVEARGSEVSRGVWQQRPILLSLQLVISPVSQKPQEASFCCEGFSMAWLVCVAPWRPLVCGSDAVVDSVVAVRPTPPPWPDSTQGVNVKLWRRTLKFTTKPSWMMSDRTVDLVSVKYWIIYEAFLILFFFVLLRLWCENQGMLQLKMHACLILVQTFDDWCNHPWFLIILALALITRRMLFL